MGGHSGRISPVKRITFHQLEGRLSSRPYIRRLESRRSVLLAIFSLGILFHSSVCSALRADVAHGQRGMVATVHPLATEAGQWAFHHGGNAIDAAVAAALTLGVVDGHNSGIGGGCFMLIRLANGRTTAIDAREAAPLAATRNMYLRNGRFDPQLSQIGPLAAGVPGSLWAYHYAVTQFGKLPLRDHLAYAAQIAARG